MKYTPLDNSVPAPPNLISNQRQADTILTLRKNQAKEMLNTLSVMSNHAADECKNHVDASTQP